MKKTMILLSLLLALLFAATPTAYGQNVGDESYTAFISVDDEVVSLTKLRENGVTITARYQGFLTASVRAGVQPSTLKQLPGVLHVAPAIRFETCADSARYYSRVDAVHAGEGLDMPFTGKGVIVGVIDCGFDFNHANFWDADGKTRVKAVYMPLDSTGRSPIVDRIMLPGSCYETPDEIQALTTDDAKTTHGTMTAGIAAGSYRGNGWHGVAPDADIVACGIPETELTDVLIANCITYIIYYAERVGKPCVINISLGSNVGLHDGTSFVPRVIQQMSGPGRVFVVSAGNDGDNPVCIHTSIASKQDTVTTLLSGYAGGPKRSGYLNAWSKDGAAFNTRLVVVDNQTGNIVYRSRPLGATSTGVAAEFSSENDSILARYYTGSVDVRGSIEANGMPSSMCEMDMRPVNNRYVMGFQYYSPSATTLSIWTSQYAYFNNYGYSWVKSGSSTGSINDIATTDSVISVGSYNSKQYVPLRDGSLYFRYFSTPEAMSYYSSYGPDENGINRPDVCAPGSVIISSANRYDTNAPNLAYWQPSVFIDGEEYPYCPDLGTSMSAPVVTGAIALWLQANPNLSVADVRKVLRHSCYKDAAVRSGNSARWGYGKLDVNEGLRYVLHIEDKNGDVNGDGEVNIGDINLLITTILGGDVSEDVRRRADVNNDGEVNIGDINMVISFILGI